MPTPTQIPTMQTIADTKIFQSLRIFGMKIRVTSSGIGKTGLANRIDRILVIIDRTSGKSELVCESLRSGTFKP